MTNGAVSGTMAAMAISMRLDRGSKAKGSKGKERDSIKEKARARQQDSRDNATHVVNMGTQRGFARRAMENPKAKGRNRQSAIAAATQDTLQSIALKAKERARQ